MSLHPSLNEESRLAAAASFKQRLVNIGHSGMCPWRDQGVPLALIQLPGSSAFEVLADCEARLESMQRCTMLPELDPAFIESPDVQMVKDLVQWPRKKPMDAGMPCCYMPWEGEGRIREEEHGAWLHVIGQERMRAVLVID